MERVQNLSQFVHWLRERKLRKQEAPDRKCRGKEEPAHASGCKCRRCMRLPQLPREHRRQQQSLRSGESPEHVYEEIPPELVASPDPDPDNPHAHYGFGGVSTRTKGKLPAKDKSTRKEKPNAKDKTTPKDHIPMNDDKDSNTRKDKSTTARINELFRANAKAQVMTSSHKEVPASQQDSSVNLGNLDFGQAKEFGGFLVVPLRDRMVFQPVLGGDAKEVPVETVRIPQTTDNEAPRNLHEFREVLTEHCKHQRRNSLPKRLHKMTEEVTTEDLQTDDLTQTKFSPEDITPVQQAKSVPDLTANQTIESQPIEQVIHVPVKTVAKKSRHSNSKSAFTRYIPTSTSTSGMAQYDSNTLSTDTSEDSGAYCNADQVASSQQESSQQTATRSQGSQGSSSDRSNDTYNEYDCKSEASSTEYDVFLQKAQQVRGFESNIQAIVRETEYSGSCSSSGKSSCSSPLSMLDMDDILALVSSDDHSELLNDIIFNPHPQNATQLKQRIYTRQVSHPPTYQPSHSSLKSKPPAPLPNDHSSDKPGSRPAPHSPPPPIPPKVSCRVTAGGPPRRVPKVGAHNRLLADLMRANHDRQLLF